MTDPIKPFRELEQQWRERQKTVERVGMIVSLSDCAEELSALIPALEAELQGYQDLVNRLFRMVGATEDEACKYAAQRDTAKEAADRFRESAQKREQAAVEAEREKCAELVSWGHDATMCADPEILQVLDNVAHDIRARGSSDALTDMLAEAEQRGIRKGANAVRRHSIAEMGSGNRVSSCRCACGKEIAAPHGYYKTVRELHAEHVDEELERQRKEAK